MLCPLFSLEDLWRREEDPGQQYGDVWSAREAGCLPEPLGQKTHVICIYVLYSGLSCPPGNREVLHRKISSSTLKKYSFIKQTRLSSTIVPVYLLLLCFHDKPPSGTSLVLCPRLQLEMSNTCVSQRTEVLEVMAGSRGKGCRNCNAEGLGTKLSLMIKEKFA